MKYLVLFLLIWKVGFLYGQADYTNRYLPLIDSARVAYDIGEMKASQQYYDLAFLVEKPRKHDYFASIKADYYAGDEDKAFQKLDILVRRWGHEKEHIVEFVVKYLPDSILVSNKMKLFENKYDSNIKKFNKLCNNRDTILVQELTNLVDLDQKYRKPGVGNWEVQKRIDKEVLFKLKELVIKNGSWFSQDQIGDVFAFGIALHIRKDDHENALFFRDVFQKAVKEGALSRHLYEHYLKYTFQRAFSIE